MESSVGGRDSKETSEPRGMPSRTAAVQRDLPGSRTGACLPVRQTDENGRLRPRGLARPRDRRAKGFLVAAQGAIDPAQLPNFRPPGAPRARTADRKGWRNIAALSVARPDVVRVEPIREPCTRAASSAGVSACLVAGCQPRARRPIKSVSKGKLNTRLGR
jgi:hypothetical protein